MTSLTDPDTSVPPRAAPANPGIDTGSGATVGPLTVLGVLILRDLRIVRRNPMELIVRSIMQPLGWAFVLAYVLPTIGASAFAVGSNSHAVTYPTILAPGLVASTIIVQGMMFTTFGLITEFAYNKEIDDRALMPAPMWVLAANKVITGAVKGAMAGLVVFPIVVLVHAKGAAPDLQVNWPVLIVVFMLSCVMASALGVFIATVMDVMVAQGITMVLITPLTMLGCIYFPWFALSKIPWLMYLSVINPVVYVSEGMRAGLTQQVGHMPLATILPVLALLTAGMCWLSAKSYQRRVLS